MKKVSVETECSVVIGNEIWFFASEFNGLFSYDLINNQLDEHGKVPWEAFDGVNLFGSMQYVKDEIYLFPLLGTKIAIYNITKHQFDGLELDYELTYDEKGVMLATSVVDNYIYAFCLFKPTIICIETEYKRVSYLHNWYNEINEEPFDEKEIFFRKQLCLYNKKIWIPFCNINAILELDCITQKIKVHNLGKKKQGYSGICYIDGKFYCAPRVRGGELISWDFKTNNCQVLSKEVGMSNKMYAAILAGDNEVMLYPATNMKCCLSGKKGTIIKGNYSYLYENDYIVILQEKESKEFHIWNKENKKLTIYKIEIPIESTSFVQELKEKTVHETSWKGISELNKYIIENENVIDRTKASTIGEKIYLKIED